MGTCSESLDERASYTKSMQNVSRLDLYHARHHLLVCGLSSSSLARFCPHGLQAKPTQETHENKFYHKRVWDVAGQGLDAADFRNELSLFPLL